MKKERNYRKLIIKLFNLKNNSAIERVKKLSEILTTPLDSFIVEYERVIKQKKLENIIRDIETILIESMKEYIQIVENRGVNYGV